MKVRIIKSEAWHRGMIGEVFNTTAVDRSGMVYITTPGAHNGNGLFKTDYEVIEAFDQPMKFRVKDKADSERIQRALFKLGAHWAVTGTNPEYTDRKYLFLSKSGYLTHANRDQHFEEHENVERFIDNDGDISIRDPQSATKIVTFDGKKYEVPGYAKFLTRDGTDRNVYAWEKKPTWMGGGTGYYDTDSNNNRQRVEEYVEPLPEGALIVEVA